PIISAVDFRPCLLCSRYRLPRPPPSFPTRRSSDLMASASSATVNGLLPARMTSVGRRMRRSDRQWPSLRSYADSIHCVSPLPSKDRKSTRLNSSHVKISYAVFCLKKKKTTQNEHKS